RISTTSSRPQQFLRNGLAFKHSTRLRITRRAVDQPFGEFCLPVKAGHRRIGPATVTLQELNHFPITTAISLIHRSAARINIRVWIRAAPKKDFCHVVLSSGRAMPKRHAPRENNNVFVSSSESCALIRVESEIQEHC